jgi:mannose/fructose/N-acetylgalactosamine-specific phosphotransferase system component IIC
VLAGGKVSVFLGVVPIGLAMSRSLDVASIIGHVACIVVGVRHRLSVALALPLVLIVHKNELGHVKINLRQMKRLVTLPIATISLVVKDVLFWRVEVVWVRVRALAAFCNGNICCVRRCRSFNYGYLHVGSRWLSLYGHSFKIGWDACLALEFLCSANLRRGHQALVLPLDLW